MCSVQSQSWHGCGPPGIFMTGVLCMTPGSMRSFRALIDKAHDRAQTTPARAHRLFADRRPGIPDVQSVLSAPERYQLRACRGSCDAVHSL